jgi:hypothetical protein
MALDEADLGANQLGVACGKGGAAVDRLRAEREKKGTGSFFVELFTLKYACPFLPPCGLLGTFLWTCCYGVACVKAR